VFISRINASLEAFRQAWNCHPLSTEGNHSPLQLHTAGSIGSCLFDDNKDVYAYGHDPEAPTPTDDEESSVEVPDTDNPLSQQSVQVLQATINPIQTCQDHGIELYRNTLRTVFELMQNDNVV